jgi:lauroyl/myristoyl acyltransferase
MTARQSQLLRRLSRVPVRGAFALFCWLGALGGAGALGRVRLGHLLGELHYWFGIRKRRDLERQLTRVLLPAHGDQHVRAVLRHAYRANDRAILEIATLYRRRLPDADVRAACRIDGLRHLRAVLGDGRGAMLLGMHMGNGILMAVRLAIEGFPVSVVYRQSSKAPSDFLDRALDRYGIETIAAARRPANGAERRDRKALATRTRARAFLQMTRALKRGRVLYVLMDQGASQGDVHVQFLGKDIALPEGPAQLVRRAGAPVLAALPLASEPSWQFRIESHLAIDPGAEPAELTAAFGRVMEAHIRAYPHLWTWHHRRWRHYPFVSETAGARTSTLVAEPA